VPVSQANVQFWTDVTLRVYSYVFFSIVVEFLIIKNINVCSQVPFLFSMQSSTISVQYTVMYHFYSVCSQVPFLFSMQSSTVSIQYASLAHM
jgi:hypothetical protein